MLRPEKQLSIKLIISVLCVRYELRLKKQHSIAQQPGGNTLMRLMSVWSRNKERDQAAHCMMGMWLIYIHAAKESCLVRRGQLFFFIPSFGYFSIYYSFSFFHSLAVVS
jgi:hypothetical protein